MSKLDRKSPFRYGHGNIPAHFAGRKDEIKEIFYYLEDLNDEKDENGRLVDGTDTPFMIIGPRGVGKTTLLTKAKTKAKELGIECYTLLKKDFNNNFGSLVDKLTKKNRSVFDVSLDEVNFNLTELINVKLRPNNSDSILEQIFEINIKSNPMLLICDEAHEYNHAEFGDFANFIQYLITESYPIAVIYAGTPKLSRVIGNIDASFIDRTRFIFLNQLSTEDSIEAIQVPFAKYDIKFEDGVLEMLVAAADYYPYFLQIIGSKLWEIVYQNNLSNVDSNSAKQAIDNSLPIRDEFYARRYLEIRNSKYKKLFIDTLEFIKSQNNSIEYNDLMDYLENSFKDIDYLEAYNDLIDLGVVWRVGTIISPGIPSFFNYVLNKVGKSTN